MKVAQGDVLWLNLPGASGSGPSGPHYGVVVQNSRFNDTALRTTVVAMMTSKLHYSAFPGNVRLRKGEASLPKPSVVLVTQLLTIDLDDIDDRLGTVDGRRVAEIWAGISQALAPVTGPARFP